jgi:AsmA protein
MESGKENSRFSLNWRGLARKRSVRIAGAAVALLLLILIAIPLFVNADTFRPTLEQKLSAALGRQVTLGHLSFSLLSGSLVAQNVAIADDPAFSSAPFFQVKSLRIGVSTTALLFRRQANLTSFTAEAPEIHLISRPDGTWNYASLASGGSGGSSAQAGAAPEVSIGELKIKDGSVEVSSLPATGNPFVYNHVELTVKNLSLATAMPFELTADLPAGGTVKLSGTAGPIGQPNAMFTPLQAALEIKHFDPVAAGVLPAADGISAVADLDAQINSDGKTLTTTGKLTAANLKLAASGSPAQQPVSANLNLTQNLAARTGQVTDLAVQTGSLAAHLQGTYQVTGDSATLNLHLAAPGLPVDGLEQLLPAVGIRLPSGSSLHGGTLTANLNVTGTPATLRIAGPVEIDGTRLDGYALASKIEGLAGSLTGSGGSSTANATEIRKLSAQVVSTPQSTELTAIDCEVPSLGTATGGGTVAASGALNFQLSAKLGSAASGGGLMNTAGGFLHTASSNGIPLTIGGTTSSPSFRLNFGSMLKQQAGGLAGQGSNAKSGILGAAQGLLNKK